MSELVGWIDWAKIGFLGCLVICFVMGWKYGDTVRGSDSDSDLICALFNHCLRHRIHRNVSLWRRYIMTSLNLLQGCAYGRMQELASFQ